MHACGCGGPALTGPQCLPATAAVAAVATTAAAALAGAVGACRQSGAVRGREASCRGVRCPSPPSLSLRCNALSHRRQHGVRSPLAPACSHTRLTALEAAVAGGKVVEAAGRALPVAGAPGLVGAARRGPVVSTCVVVGPRRVAVPARGGGGRGAGVRNALWRQVGAWGRCGDAPWACCARWRWRQHAGLQAQLPCWPAAPTLCTPSAGPTHRLRERERRSRERERERGRRSWLRDRLRLRARAW